MYPDWPKSKADLAPLPQCPGPKLEAFAFDGAQQIEFLEFLGEGAHSFVLKVKIQGQIYALKVFRFQPPRFWSCMIAGKTRLDDLEAMSAYYNFIEPFNNECRAFARLRDTGYENLSIRCHGYILLDEEHEKKAAKLLSRHADTDIDGLIKGGRTMRNLFVGRGGRVRPPPLRAIVKAFGTDGVCREPQTRHMRKLLQDMKYLHQLGIFRFDLALADLIDGKIADFSMAFTLPHIAASPELNPLLAPAEIQLLDEAAFRHSLQDYFDFDNIVDGWNYQVFEADTYAAKRMVGVHACLGDWLHPFPIKYRLRPTPARRQLYTLVDPRRGAWEAAPPIRLPADTPRWQYSGSGSVADELRRDKSPNATKIEYVYRDGRIYPRKPVHRRGPPPPLRLRGDNSGGGGDDDDDDRASIPWQDSWAAGFADLAARMRRAQELQRADATLDGKTGQAVGENEENEENADKEEKEKEEETPAARKKRRHEEWILLSCDDGETHWHNLKERKRPRF